MKEKELEVLKALKKAIIEKFGDTREVKLPNNKVVFFVPASEAEYQEYNDQLTNVFLSKTSKKKNTLKTIPMLHKELALKCLYRDTNKIDCLGTEEDLKRYPAVASVAAGKIEEMAGGNIDEDFLL